MSSDVQLLADAVRENLLSRAECKRIVKRHAREVVFTCGSRADAVYFVEAGHVKLERTSSAGTSLVVGIRGYDELIAEETALGDSIHAYSATMLTSGVVWAIPAQSLVAVCDQHPELWRIMAKYTWARKAEVERRVARMTSNAVRSRILDQLLELGHRTRTGDGADGTIPLSQLELASLIGATRETTSTALNMLQREGLVLIGHRKVTLQPAALSNVRSAAAI